MTWRPLLSIAALAVAVLGTAGAAASRLLAANLPCVTAHAPFFGGIAGHGNPCTRTALTWPPIPGWALGLLAAAALTGLVAAGLASATRQLTGAHRLVRATTARRIPLSPRLQAAAEGTGHGLTVVDASVTAFCHGLRHPRIILGHHYAASLDDDELHAVLNHEMSHARRHDPTRLMLARSLARAVFFLPAVADLVRTIELRTELIADRRAIATTHTRALTGALLKASDHTPLPPPALAVGHFDAALERLDHLATGQIPPVRIKPHRTAATLAGLAILTLTWAWIQPVAHVDDTTAPIEAPVDR